MQAWIGSYELTPDDDDFHPPGEHPHFFEGVWFSFHVPSRNMQGYVYLKFWPNQGVYGGGVLVWDHTSNLPWEAPYYDFHWHEPWPDVDTLKNCRFPNGIGIQCLEPLTRYHITFDSERLQLDFIWDAILPAFAQARGDVGFLFSGHIDHPGHVTGQMTLDGEVIQLNCAAIRDRSWGPRTEDSTLRMGYCHGANTEHTAFLAISNPVAKDDPVTGGYYYADGEIGSIVSGNRTLQRSKEGYPTAVQVSAVDELGRNIVADGKILSRQGFRTHHGIFHWLSYTEWTVNGVKTWGEDEDLWHPELWRQFYRNELLPNLSV